METISIPKRKFEQMRIEIQVLRNSKMYKRLLEFEEKISQGKKYGRKDLGF
jgi:PHD/YefM family antitoxin component YafN of YafNO toxin-antitoxin module